MPHALRILLASLVTTMLLVTGAMASEPADPRPFAASYRLEINGWPSARVEHQLTRQGNHWQSDMRAAIAMARGSESSRFRIGDDGIRASAYHSGYSLLGIGGKYRLGHDDLASLPDRQTALFELSRQAVQARCDDDQPPCEFRYQDHKGREETLHYRVVERSELTLPAGNFDAITIESWDPEHPERRLIFSFHPELPGLLLAIDYRREGERKSRLTLTELSLSE
ncbi:hypothetical protein GCM10007160_11650 [Litchfieldella qijiaojingensis]|uniref:DUF3108 domain-containing protein n=1 Tax=Litchfieldella qijiaojingensis TaxID=980347 RepID=A0ABQ2YKK3_9GAMM|nr:hypothetical protein [Halomonas qijiaojingensis]GGX86087.1 hypothetical protein GCM10007160_11650 [Halomonas qijiaojingensis]